MPPSRTPGSIFCLGSTIFRRMGGVWEVRGSSKQMEIIKKDRLAHRQCAAHPMCSNTRPWGTHTHTSRSVRFCKPSLREYISPLASASSHTFVSLSVFHVSQSMSLSVCICLCPYLCLCLCFWVYLDSLSRLCFWVYLDSLSIDCGDLLDSLRVHAYLSLLSPTSPEVYLPLLVASCLYHSVRPPHPSVSITQ